MIRFERVDAERRWPRVPLLCLGAAGLWTLLVMLAAWWLPAAARGESRGTPCILRATTGVPCPTCGGTRAVTALVGGDVGGAIAWNPMVIGGLVLLVAWLALRVALLRRVVVVRRRWLVAVTLVAVVVANWVYVLATQGVDPPRERPPDQNTSNHRPIHTPPATITTDV
ncbi:MAG: DUF2752 domain-containing protein [Phycisphaeraceae bacterium]|nr:DUF2752 domain-containing protein [Phycisphaeraceae bacterium]